MIEEWAEGLVEEKVEEVIEEWAEGLVEEKVEELIEEWAEGLVEESLERPSAGLLALRHIAVASGRAETGSSFLNGAGALLHSFPEQRLDWSREPLKSIAVKATPSIKENSNFKC